MCDFEDFVKNLRLDLISVLDGYFINKNPTLQEIAKKTIEYCDADSLPTDGNIYVHTFPSGKLYCGQTKNFNDRMIKYKNNNGTNQHMKLALDKYGFENVVTNKVEVPRICMDFIEIFVIHNYDLMNPRIGYNKDSGGTYGWTVSEETRKKISESTIGRIVSDETRVKMSESQTGVNNSFYGKRHTDKTIDEISAALSGRIITAKHREKLSVSMVGKIKTKEHRANLSASLSGKKTGRNGDLSPVSKQVVVGGTIYGSAAEATRTVFPDNHIKYVSNFIRAHNDSDLMFYISNEFYMYCKYNKVSNITREMFENY